MMVHLTGFLSLVFDCFVTKTLPQKIERESNYFSNFLETPVTFTTDFEKAKRVFTGIEKNIGYTALYNTYYAFLSNEKEKELHLLKYLFDGFTIGPKINNRLTLPYVFKVMAMKKRSFRRMPPFKGFTSFSRIGKSFILCLYPSRQ